MTDVRDLLERAAAEVTPNQTDAPLQRIQRSSAWRRGLAMATAPAVVIALVVVLLTALSGGSGTVQVGPAHRILPPPGRVHVWRATSGTVGIAYGGGYAWLGSGNKVRQMTLSGQEVGGFSFAGGPVYDLTYGAHMLWVLHGYPGHMRLNAVCPGDYGNFVALKQRPCGGTVAIPGLGTSFTGSAFLPWSPRLPSDAESLWIPQPMLNRLAIVTPTPRRARAGLTSLGSGLAFRFESVPGGPTRLVQANAVAAWVYQGTAHRIGVVENPRIIGAEPPTASEGGLLLASGPDHSLWVAEHGGLTEFWVEYPDGNGPHHVRWQSDGSPLQVVHTELGDFVATTRGVDFISNRDLADDRHPTAFYPVAGLTDRSIAATPSGVIIAGPHDVSYWQPER